MWLDTQIGLLKSRHTRLGQLQNLQLTGVTQRGKKTAIITEGGVNNITVCNITALLVWKVTSKLMLESLALDRYA